MKSAFAETDAGMLEREKNQTLDDRNQSRSFIKNLWKAEEKKKKTTHEIPSSAISVTNTPPPAEAKSAP
jgi:predicted DNA binding CopG/RHH family protein